MHSRTTAGARSSSSAADPARAGGRAVEGAARVAAYLASRRERWPELTRTMRRIGHDVPDDVEYVEAARRRAGPAKTAAIGNLFSAAVLCATRWRCAARSSSA